MSKQEKARAKLAANPLPESPYLHVGEDQILIKCGFSEQLLQLLRWIPKLEWRPDLRGWTLPITAAETLRSVLPEVLRLAEATEEIDARATPAGEAEVLSAAEHFKMAARLLFGADWQRETARALGRDETALALFLLGEPTLDDAEQLYADMLMLMRRRATEISAAADRFAFTLGPQSDSKQKPPQTPKTSDQGI